MGASAQSKKPTPNPFTCGHNLIFSTFTSSSSAEDAENRERKGRPTSSESQTEADSEQDQG